MEETNTPNLTLNYTIYGSLDIEEFNNYNCSNIPSALLAFAGVCLGISIFGLVGNGMVMWFLGFHMKQNPFTVYTLNLAVADFSLTLLFFLLIMAFLVLIAFCSYLSNFATLQVHSVYVVEPLCYLFELSSLGLQAALSVEHCASILFPVWYRCHRPKHLSGIVSAVLWALVGLFVFFLYYISSQDCEEILEGLALVFALILLLMLLISNLLPFHKLRCGCQRRQPGKLFVAILLNVIVLFSFGIPFCVAFFLTLPTLDELFPQNSSLLLALLDHCLDPVIYVLVGSCQCCHFQCSIKAALRRVFEEKTGSEEESHVPGNTVVEVTPL